MVRLLKWTHVYALMAMLFSIATLAASEGSDTAGIISSHPSQSATIAPGTLSVEFDEALLWDMGIEIITVGGTVATQNDGLIEFEFDLIRPFRANADPGIAPTTLAVASGAIVLEQSGNRVVVSAIKLYSGQDGSLWIQSAVHDPKEVPAFALQDANWYNDRFGRQQLSGDIVLTQSAATQLGDPGSSGFIIGHLLLSEGPLHVDVERADLATENPPRANSVNAHSLNQSSAPSPDVIVGDLHELNSYGTDGSVSAFSVGTVSCNIGVSPLNWFFNVNMHPVIGQNMYRYKEGHFEQIGMSWLKHGFFALSQNLCSQGQCDGDPTGEHLGPGCSDPYSAFLNGQQGNLGPRSEVNAFTGDYPFPFGGAPVDSLLSRRLQVNNDDLAPALNVGAEYFVEGQYVTPDDASAKNGWNNASYRKIIVTEAGGSFVADYTVEDTVRTLPAIHAWQAIDPQVQIVGVSVPSEGIFTLGARVTNLGNGTWHYEYALHNLNSHRSARSFSVPIFPGIVLSNIEFHDVPYHSGEPYSQTPWQVQITNDAITWSTDDFSIDPNANALRWGTMYNFRFDADAHAAPLVNTIGLFRPGTPDNVTAVASAPTNQLVAPDMVLSPYDDPKDRYISIDPSTNASQVIAVRVTRANSTDTAFVSCAFEDLGVQGVFSSLVATPEFCSWSTPVLHIGGCMIAPGNTYTVESTLDGIDFTVPLMVSTTNVPIPRAFGDVVGPFVDDVWTSPDGIVSATDIVASVQGFQLIGTAALIARLDVVPERPNHILAANDILAIVLGFAGEPYQFGTSCPTGTCEPVCTIP